MADPVALSISTPNRSTPIQFSHQIHTALDQENFLVWKSQILPILRGHGLIGFVDGSIPSPPQFLIDSTGNQSINPEFQHWHQQDQLILAWIFNSISPSLLTQLVRCETSAQLWSTILQLHSSQSVAKILDLKLQLQTAKKGASTCAQFLQKMQALADRLRSVGSDISDDDLVLYIAQGLGSDYENFITALSMRFSPPTMVEFSSLLLTHEARLLNTLKASSTTAIHLTTQSNASDSGLSDNSIYYANGNRAQFPNSRGRSHQFRGRGNSRGRGRGR